MELGYDLLYRNHGWNSLDARGLQEPMNDDDRRLFTRSYPPVSVVTRDSRGKKLRHLIIVGRQGPNGMNRYTGLPCQRSNITRPERRYRGPEIHSLNSVTLSPERLGGLTGGRPTDRRSYDYERTWVIPNEITDLFKERNVCVDHCQPHLCLSAPSWDGECVN